VGIMGIRDSVRADVPHAVREALAAGVQVVMITGDRKGTALSIAHEVGLMDGGGLAINSLELQAMDDEQLRRALPELRVVARALPSDKSRLVRVAQSMGRVVGMTGDGVNDAPALKQADVGFGMGSGSEVAKEASDIVILDDNFASIANAVLYGRTIYQSIQKFIVFQLTVNLAAVLTAFLAPFLGIDFPLTIIQILWINMVMDTLAALAFGGEPALRRYLELKPVPRAANILTPYMRQSILFGGLYITALSMLFLNLPHFKGWFLREGAFHELAYLTGFFNLFMFLIAFNSFNARTSRLNLGEHLGENKGFIRVIALIFGLQVVFTIFGGSILRTVPLSWEEWGKILLLSATIIPADLLRKRLAGEGKVG
jgi:calcium-translocating P-type ATPase